MLHDDALLPGRKAAACLGLRRADATVQPCEFVHEHAPEGPEIQFVIAIGSGDHRVQLGDRVPKSRIIEEQARQRAVAFAVACGVVRKACRVEVEVGYARGNSVLRPVLVTMTGRDEYELAPQILERGTRRTVEPCLAV